MNTKSFLLKTVVIAGICTPLSQASAIGTKIDPSWSRPTSNSQAAATLTTTAEWDGFASVDASNKPTAATYFGGSVIPTAGDSSSASDGAFPIYNGTANNTTYYPPNPDPVSVGDIYSFSGVLTPQVTVPGYNIAGNLLNVLVQVEQDGSNIDPTLLTVNGVQASSLSNYNEETTASASEGTMMGQPIYRADYAWSFTLPSDTDLLQLNFGWGVTSAALTSVVVDTQSATVPEPASMVGLGLAGFLAIRRNRRVR